MAGSSRYGTPGERPRGVLYARLPVPVYEALKAEATRRGQTLSRTTADVIAAALAADVAGPEPRPPHGSNIKGRLIHVRALAQERQHAWATVQLADLVQELYEWRDQSADRDAWDGSEWHVR